jgi:hypothetical protein
MCKHTPSVVSYTWFVQCDIAIGSGELIIFWKQAIYITHSLSHSWSWALLENSPIVEPLKNFPAFYRTRKFITVITRALQWSLSWARSIQSIQSRPISLKSIFILFTHLRLDLPSGLFSSGFPTNILYGFLWLPFVLQALPISSSLSWSL